MPELPEVETVKLALSPKLSGCIISQVTMSNKPLRWRLSEYQCTQLSGQTILSITRRAKYLIFKMTQGDLVAHLGMSGYLALQPKPLNQPHVHLCFYLNNQQVLSYCDPRRFGGWQWLSQGADTLPSLQRLGPEPLSPSLDIAALWQRLNQSKLPIKQWLMNQVNIVGVGNIYANEALFLAKIHPNTRSCLISKKQAFHLVECVQMILKQAISQGGTTLKDFQSSNGQLGYFQQTLKVYQRQGLPCLSCSGTIESWRLGQRSTFACTQCQPYKSF